MKKLILTAILITMAFINESNAKHYINYYKQGGIFNLYWSVTQVNTSIVGNDEFWNVTCNNPGATSCRFNPHHRSVSSNTSTLLSYCNPTMDNMTANAETQITQGVLTGTIITTIVSNPWSQWPPIPIKLTWNSVDNIGTSYTLCFEIG